MAKGRRNRRDPKRANRRLPVSSRSFFDVQSWSAPRPAYGQSQWTSKTYSAYSAELKRARELQSKPTTSSFPKTYSNVKPIESALTVCVKRQQRKEILHALGKSGQAGQKKPRFTAASLIKCRRNK